MITLTEAKHAAWLWGARPDLREAACWVLYLYVRALPPGPQRNTIMLRLGLIAERAEEYAVPNFTTDKSREG